MKRYLIILALCGSVHAGDYADQLDRIEKQQQEILYRQRQAEWDAREQAEEAKRRQNQAYWNAREEEAMERILRARYNE